MSQHLPPPPGLDTEAAEQVRPESNFRGISDVQRWKKEDWMNIRNLCLVLRALTFFFCFLILVLVVTIPGFTKWPDFCYLLSIAIIVIIYSAVAIGLKGQELCTGLVMIPHNIALWIDFFGDQCLALLLLSAASSASSIVREVPSILQGAFDEAHYSWAFKHTVYGSHGQATVAMAFLAFFTLKSLALISGYNFAVHLSNS